MKTLNITIRPLAGWQGFRPILLYLGLALSGGTLTLAAQAAQTALSLNTLSEIAGQTLGQEKALPEEARRLCGIGQVDSYVIDPAHNDIVLVGRQADNNSRPTLHYDDLVLLLRSAWGKSSDHAYPYCSLDPQPRNIRALNSVLAQTPDMTKPERLQAFAERVRQTLGGQQVVVGGVPVDSRIAHAMIDADYRMKQVSQGQKLIAEIPSLLDRSKKTMLAALHSGTKVPQPGMSMARFWFHIANGDPRFEASESGDMVRLASAKVVVLTERQKASADGSLHDSGEEDPEMQAFATDHSEQFPKVAQRVAEYADLENLYRLLALVNAMKTRNATGAANIDLGYLLDASPLTERKAMPSELPGLANYDLVKEEVPQGNDTMQYFFFPMVTGGVSMDTPLTASNFVAGDSGAMLRQRAAILKQKPHDAAMCWTVE